MTNHAQSIASKPRGSSIPWVFAGIFAFVVGVNGVMIWFATRTFSGIVVERPYERGLAYDSVIADRAHVRNWLHDLEVERLGQGVAITLLFLSDEIASADSITGTLSRPLTAGQAVPLRFAATSRGAVAFVDHLLPGQWNLVLKVQGNPDRNVDRRITVP